MSRAYCGKARPSFRQRMIEHAVAFRRFAALFLTLAGFHIITGIKYKATLPDDDRLFSIGVVLLGLGMLLFGPGTLLRWFREARKIIGI